MATKKVRYGVVGLGWISQQALLPGFANATANSELTALISSDPEKREALGDKYKVAGRYSYEQYDDCLRSGEVDAVYIGLPNNMHREYTEKAARAGVHVLCEKPMAPTVADCQSMIAACAAARVKLMIAYRLHFDEMHMGAVDAVLNGEIGDLRFFTSSFAEEVQGRNIRLRGEFAGGPIWDIGVYCINAARYFFRAEPTEVFAFKGNSGDPKFREINEAYACTMRFPGDRLAQFTCSFGTQQVNTLRVAGTQGDILMNPSYGFVGKRSVTTTKAGKSTETAYKERDHFGPQLEHFSDCILHDHEPGPSGEEGLADARIAVALHESADTGRPVRLEPFERSARPTGAQIIKASAVSAPKLVNAATPSGK